MPEAGPLVVAKVPFSSRGSLDPGGSIVSYHWNFGDSTFASTANPSHSYAAPGLYTATLTVTDNSGLLASATALVTIANGANARLDPLNATGGSAENPLSRNFNWSLPLVSLPGRAGLNLGLILSYNSLVWTRSGSYISFDDDRGFPSAGFRLGFPVIQPSYYNSEIGTNAFLLIGSDGSRTELRRVGSTTLYEAADSSYLLLDSSTMVLRTTAGTQLKYELKGSEYQCTEIKDRNGNYITINYTTFGRIDAVIDTLGRNIKFNYDSNGWLISITQIWNQNSPSQVSHNWATFEYTNTSINTSFTGLTVSGPSNNSTIKTLSKVTLADGSHSDFSYTSWGQVWKVSSFAADNHLLNYRSYNLPQTATAQLDCPRFTERRDWAENWNQNISGVEQEAVTTFAEPVPNATWTVPHDTENMGTLSRTGTRADVTAPNGTKDELYFIDPAGTTSDWRRGLLSLVVNYDSSGNWQRKVMTTWTQDNTSVAYIVNPRVTETNTYDPAGNRARVQLTYQQLTFGSLSCRLPRDVIEYAADASTKLRSTRTDYHTGTAYSDRRIIGLVTEKRLYEGDVNAGGVLKARVGFFYDNELNVTSIQGNDAPTQHDDTGYSSSFFNGRANLSSVRRYEVVNGVSTGQSTTTTSKFNTAGVVVSIKDALNHETQISYADSYSDNNNSRGTFAYPTMLTDPDGYTSITKYHFDFGAVTYGRTPQPNVTANQPGPEQTTTYDTIGRPQQVTNLVTGAYTRFVYPTTMTRVETYATIQSALAEAYSAKYTDGAGRVIATATEHPGSVGGYSGQKFVYDVMGQRIKTSNPTETSASGAPSQWVTAGDDAAAGWVYTQQTYDWKGRPLVTTNQDGTTKIASYAGCGCAGGEVVTLTDEGTLNAGVEKRRQRKIYSDVLGRTVKTETLNWENGSVYAATVQTYNVLDQPLLTREYAGPEGSTTYQDTTVSYDGYGRLSSKHVPEQTGSTTWGYNADDTVQSITDARSAVTNFTYNARHLLTGMTHTLGSEVLTQSFSYDAAGNRTSMTDPSGSTAYHYTALSQIDWETRTFAGLAGSYTLTYEYTIGGQLKNITDHTNQRVNYGYDEVGRLNNIVGTNYNSNQFITNIKARAWGGSSEIVYGNGLKASYNYNNRLQTEHFQLTTSGGVNRLSLDYEYHDDGSLRYTQNLLNAVLDRSFEHDHVGRLTKALSGAEARGEPATNNRPYKETATYDAFNHLNLRTSRHWSRTLGFASNDTYVDNRRVGWTYDANGNWLTGGGRTHVYDAAGRTKSITWSTGDQFNQFFDADGQRVKTVESNITIYYLRSTVLGGKVIEELNPSGAKEQGFIYAGEKLIGNSWGSGNVVLQYEDPSGYTVRSSSPTSDLAGYWAELDPWGAEVFNFDPYAADPEFSGGRGEGGPVFPGHGDISMPSLGCTQLLDGVLTLCDFASRNMNGGGILLERRKQNGTRELLSINVYLGVTWIWHEPRSGNSPMHIDYREVDDPVIRTNNSFPGYWEVITTVIAQHQQLVTKPIHWYDLAKIRMDVKKILDRGRCREFIEKLLQRAKTKDDEAKHTNLMDLFDAVLMQGGFFSKPAGFSTVEGAVGAPGGAKVLLSSGSEDFKDSNPALRIRYYAFDALNELLHVAGSKPSYYATGAFSDYHLALVAFDLALEMGTGVPNQMLGIPIEVDPNKDPDGRWTHNLHNTVKEFCKRDF